MNYNFNNPARSEYNARLLFGSHIKVLEDNTKSSWASMWKHKLKLAYNNACNSTESIGSFTSVIVHTKYSVNVQVT